MSYIQFSSHLYVCSAPNNFIPLSQQRHGHSSHAEDLHVKLSIKKKIWTGAHGDSDVRQLGWYKGQSQAHAHMATVMATAAATAVLRSAGGSQAKEPLISAAESTGSAILPPAYVGAPRRSRKLEQVDLFK